MTSSDDHLRRLAERRRGVRLVRESLGLLTSKWTADVLLALGDGSRRYHELLAELDPISEKVLTQTLRAMERDGLVGRRVRAEVPPRVDYALTPLGASLAAPMKALAGWTLAHGADVERARARFDARRAPEQQPPQAA
jgi:DNA-binding HxlR family transcriptional regulator